jgi:hypothetical protein
MRRRRTGIIYPLGFEKTTASSGCFRLERLPGGTSELDHCDPLEFAKGSPARHAGVLSRWPPFKEGSVSEGRYWFPAKRYGWGWGLPCTWEGWLVMAAFIALITAGAWLFPPLTMLGFYSVYIVILSALLFGVCWLTGEPLRWRWGGDRRA